MVPNRQGQHSAETPRGYLFPKPRIAVSEKSVLRVAITWAIKCFCIHVGVTLGACAEWILTGTGPLQLLAKQGCSQQLKLCLLQITASHGAFGRGGSRWGLYKSSLPWGGGTGTPPWGSGDGVRDVLSKASPGDLNAHRFRIAMSSLASAGQNRHFSFPHVGCFQYWSEAGIKPVLTSPRAQRSFELIGNSCRSGWGRACGHFQVQLICG